jgi:hypothetical protein
VRVEKIWIEKGIQKIVGYQCRLCGLVHAEMDDAEKCAARGFEPVFSPGDIVVIELGYTWFTGDAEWVLVDKGHTFHDRPTHAFLYVVTAVESYQAVSLHPGDGHEPIYHLVTGAFENVRCCWNSPEGGRKMRCAKESAVQEKYGITQQRMESVIQKSRQYIGQRSNDLIG